MINPFKCIPIKLIKIFRILLSFINEVSRSLNDVKTIGLPQNIFDFFSQEIERERGVILREMQEVEMNLQVCKLFYQPSSQIYCCVRTADTVMCLDTWRGPAM